MTLVIEGDLAQAQTTEAGRRCVAKARLALITGGRGFLRGAGVRGTVTSAEFVAPGIKITLDQGIVRRINTAGSELTEEEIAAGMEQLRVSDEDIARATRQETEAAIFQGVAYGQLQYGLAINEGDERALHNAWEMARKVNGLRKRLAAMNEASAV